MISTSSPPPKASAHKVQQAQHAFAKLLADASRRGFHGTAGIALIMQDGHIQHLRVSMEQIVK